MQIPSDYNRLMPYLIVPGGAAFIRFMETVFGATVQRNIPRSENLIMHAELRIDDAVIMCADATEEFAARPAGLFIYVESTDAVYKKAIEAGASSLMEPATMDYGYTCGFRDPFGNDWWATEPPAG